MANITKGKTWVDAEKVNYTDINGNFDTIYNEFNGNIDNANIKSAAAIDPTKIAGSAMTLSGTDSVSGVKTFSKQLTLTELTTPTAPSATNHQLYFKADGKLYTQNSAAVEQDLSFSGKLQSIQQTSTLTLNTTTSATDVVLMSLTFTTTAIANIIVSPTIVWQQSNTTGSNYADIYLDGALQGSSTFLQEDYTANGKYKTISGRYTLTSVSAAAHTIDIRYRVASNTTTATVQNAVLLCEVFNA